MNKEILKEAAETSAIEQFEAGNSAYILGFYNGAEWYKKQLKYKVKEAIEIIEKLEINEISKQGGISSLKLILNEK